MTEEQLRNAFENHMNSRGGERPSREMLFEMFREGYKLGWLEQETADEYAADPKLVPAGQILSDEEMEDLSDGPDTDDDDELFDGDDDDDNYDDDEGLF
jgi:hypothetical protein